MKFKGLPANVWKGGAEVYAQGKECPLLQSCSFCDFFHHTYYLCPHAHVTCSECQGRTRGNGEHAPCRTCAMQATRITVSTVLIENMDFSCGCGYSGTLQAIKTHRASPDYSEKCEKIRDEGDSTVFALRKELHEVEMVLNAVRNELQIKLDRIRGIGVNFGLELVDRDRIKRTTNDIRELGNRADQVLEVYHELKAENHQIRAMLHAVLTEELLQAFPIESIVSGAKVEKSMENSSMKATIRLALNNDSSADLLVKASFQRGFMCPKKLVGKILVVRHLDQNGYTLKEASFEIQSDGTLGYVKPSTIFLNDMEQHLFRRVPHFIDRSFLCGPSMLVSDWIYISAELCSGSKRSLP